MSYISAIHRDEQSYDGNSSNAPTAWGSHLGRSRSYWRSPEDLTSGRADLRAMASKKVNAEIHDLKAMRAALGQLRRWCHGDVPAAACPIITALQNGDMKETNDSNGDKR